MPCVIAAFLPGPRSSWVPLKGLAGGEEEREAKREDVPSEPEDVDAEEVLCPPGPRSCWVQLKGLAGGKPAAGEVPTGTVSPTLFCEVQESAHVHPHDLLQPLAFESVWEAGRLRVTFKVT